MSMVPFVGGGEASKLPPEELAGISAILGASLSGLGKSEKAEPGKVTESAKPTSTAASLIGESETQAAQAILGGGVPVQPLEPGAEADYVASSNAKTEFEAKVGSILNAVQDGERLAAEEALYSALLNVLDGPAPGEETDEPAGDLRVGDMVLVGQGEDVYVAEIIDLGDGYVLVVDEQGEQQELSPDDITPIGKQDRARVETKDNSFDVEGMISQMLGDQDVNRPD